MAVSWTEKRLVPNYCTNLDEKYEEEQCLNFSVRLVDNCDGANDDEDRGNEKIGRPEVCLDEPGNALLGLELLLVLVLALSFRFSPVSVRLRSEEEHEVQADLQGEYDSHRDEGRPIFLPKVVIVLSILL